MESEQGGANQYMRQWDELKKEMYYETGDTIIPSGLVALYNLLSTSHKHLFGPTNDFTSNEIETEVGSGNFATMHPARTL